MNSIAQLIEKQAQKFPEKVAIKHGGEMLTYERLIDTAAKFAIYLKNKQLGNGDVAGLALDRSFEMVISLMALIKAGITYLPIDNNFPAERISYMLADSSVKVLITSRKFRGKYNDFAHIIFIEDALQDCASYEPGEAQMEQDETGIAYIRYTSGSTGAPKGVAVKNNSVLNLLFSLQQQPGIDHSDTMLSSTTISFDIAEVEILLPLISGASVVIADRETVTDGRGLLAIAKAEKITIMQGTPFMWHTMLESGWDEHLPLKIFCGGEAMSKELANQLLKRCNSLWNMYGPTETTIYSTVKQITSTDTVITIGTPILNTQIYILDQAMAQVAVGEVGEIYIGGKGLADRYVNLPELTAERFVINPFLNPAGQKMYQTGDLGKILANGDIQCLGRVDKQIKIRGYRIEAGEIEHHLRLQRNIKDALVTLYKDPLQNLHLIGYVISNTTIKSQELAGYIEAWKNGLQSSLPDYMVPDNYVLIPSVPVMENGKVDYKSLPQPVIHERILNKFQSPKSEVEILLADIFLKNIAIAAIGITDNFFDMGIDSLVAVKIMVQIEKQFGKRLPLSMLIKYPTIKQLALVIQDYSSSDSTYKSLVPIKPAGTKDPLYIVHGSGLNLFNFFGMISNMDSSQPVYGLQSMGLDGHGESLTTIEAIARFYNSELLKHNPNGPFAIAGYSLGGFIAFEMVKQLQAMGKEIKMLGMFDTNLQYPTQQYPWLKMMEVKLVRQFRKFGFTVVSLFKSPGETLKYLSIFYVRETNLFLKKLGILKNYDPENLPEFMQGIAKQLDDAIKNYIVEPYDIKIDLFKAEKRIYFVDDPESLGWKPYALRGLTIHNVPGDHREMFNPPNDLVAANKLQSRLDEPGLASSY